MGAWTDTVEAKARIIHGQIAAARALALKNGADPAGVERPYLDLLNQLYRDEFHFAQLVDNSDLVARFEGPALSEGSPTVSVVTTMCSQLRKQIQGIAKSVIGLATDGRLSWPSNLDPQLSGITAGSFVVGIRIPSGNNGSQPRQASFSEMSIPLVNAVRQATKSIASVARYIGEDGVDDAIEKVFPDPAIRDTVMVAACKLAPSGRKGIHRLSFYEPDSVGVEVTPLTPKSRKVLRRVVERPVRVSQSGSFDGVVREIDLDARRFEIRLVKKFGAIRCVYTPEHDNLVREILDAKVSIEGQYETQNNQKPRLLQVASMKLLAKPAEQEFLPDMAAR